jgi:alkylation response protein AidB-like acyl-CoA dehydrogenase
MLDLKFSEEQEMLRETVRGLCIDTCPNEVIRDLEDDEIGFSADLWKQFADLDLIGLTIPEAYGGSAMTSLEQTIVYEELGRSLAPSPHFASAVMSAGVLALAGTASQKSEYLTSIAVGERIVTPASLEPGDGFKAAGVQLTADPGPAGDDFVLNGTKWHVPLAAAADQMVVLARTGAGEEAIDLFLVDRTAPGVALRQMTSISSDTQYEVIFDDVRVGADARIGPAGSGWATWNEVMADGAILLAAQAVGGAQHTLEITVQYAKDREQFDKPLGAFQAISHYLADAKTAIDGAEALVHEAAWARSQQRDVTRLAPMAKLFATQTYRDVTAMAQQVFGGVGFTVEYEVQLYFRRAKQLQITWWDSAHCEELIAQSVLDTDELEL